jgi:hypothetical protein
LKILVIAPRLMPMFGVVAAKFGPEIFRAPMIAAAIVLQLSRNTKDFDCFWSTVLAALIFSLFFKPQS